MSKHIAHISQLDALRAIAALMVIFFHFSEELSVGNFAFGQYGVEIFFTISGFLITSILLKQKAVAAQPFKKIGYFLMKRVLRLFPIYYLLLLLFTILTFITKDPVWDPGEGVYYYTYSANILFYISGQNAPQLNHVWSLAVEEQFYLVWPFLVLFIQNRKLLLIIVALIIGSLIFKFMDIENSRFLPLYNFDTLGLGALIGVLIHLYGHQLFDGFKKLLHSAWVYLAIAAFVVVPFLMTDRIVLVDLLSVFLVLGCIYGFQGPIGSIMNLNALSYLGKISYGLYLYHKPIPYFIDLAARKSGVGELNKYVLFAAGVAVTIAVAHCSYIWIEKPLLRLKDRFDL